MLSAPAVDFTEVLMWQRFPAKVKREIEHKGVWHRQERTFGAFSRSLTLPFHVDADKEEQAAFKKTS